MQTTINADAVKGFTEILRGYKKGKKNLERRVIDAEQFWKLRHWKSLRRENDGSVPPASGWITNSILSKHSAAMDAFPEIRVYPREPGDRATAEQLSKLLPAVLDRCQFRQAWSDEWWDKLKGGTGIYAVVWDRSQHRGKGDIAITPVDILNLYWKPGCASIQDSPYLFYVHMEESSHYDGLDNAACDSQFAAKYLYDDAVSTEGQVAIIDCYYKKGNLLHYCQYCGETVLYATENDPGKVFRGLYDHGLYPFVFDPLWPEKGYPGCGFGYVDLDRDAQVMVDLLNAAFAKNVLCGATPRYFTRLDGCVNPEELLDLSKPIVAVSGNVDEASLRQITTQGLPDGALEFLQMKVDEMKQVGGNRDVNNGGSGSVTAASAIAALQEAGNGLSRDMIDGSYRAVSQMVKLVISLIFQFYDAPRQFRIAGGEEFLEFSRESAQNAPDFDIQVQLQTENQYSRQERNAFALQLYQAGLLNEENRETAQKVLELMDFPGKESLKRAWQAEKSIL